ncbi:MAG: hypothetical protein JHC94_05275, partial [Acidimicrobiia bacterium]|nr:hypothetical protein [Acidimicrobiia bacterium]
MPENAGANLSTGPSRIGVQAGRFGVFLICAAVFSGCGANGVSNQAETEAKEPEASSPASKSLSK